MVRCWLSCLVDPNSDLYRLYGSFHGLDTFWAQGLSWINKETQQQQQQLTARKDSEIPVVSNPSTESIFSGFGIDNGSFIRDTKQKVPPISFEATLTCLKAHSKLKAQSSKLKAQSSKLKRRICYVFVNRDLRALSFELWALKDHQCHPKMG